MLAFNILTMTSHTVSKFASGIITGVAGVATVTQTLNNKIFKTSKLANKQADKIKGLTSTATKQANKIKGLTSTAAKQANKIKGLTFTTAKQVNKIKTLTMLNPNRLVQFRGTQMTVAKAVNTTANGIIKRVALASGRTVAAVPAQAIPFLGISAVVGISGWELKNYCDTAKEMSELNLIFNPSIEDAGVNKTCGLEIPSKVEVWDKIKNSPSAAWDNARNYSPDMPEFSRPTWDGVKEYWPEMPSITWQSLNPWGESE